MAQPVSDPIADEVATNLQVLLEEGVVRFLGYVKVVEADPGPPRVLEPIFRLYTSPSFDRWLEIETVKVRGQILASAETAGRSYIWVAADAVITQCQSGTAEYISQIMDAGGDDPTALPRGGPR